MKKNVLTVLTVGIVLSVLHLIAAVIAILKLPETIPTHFNAAWECDSTGSRWFYLIVAVLPVLTAFGALIWMKAMKPKQPKPAAKVLTIITVYFAVFFWAVYPTAASGVGIGEKAGVQTTSAAICLLIAGMFVALGNYMPVLEPGKSAFTSIGFRISWTLKNEICWRKTHRFAGKLMVVTGLLLCALFLIGLLLKCGDSLWMFFVLIGGLLVITVVPFVYAYQHRNDT